MAIYSELPVYKASYDLALEIFHLVKNFSKEYKYTIGENLKNETTDLIILIYRANSKENKGATIAEARERVEVIRLLIRLTKDLHQINTRKFILANKNVEKVSKQLTAWERFVKNK
mgnify:CR=1 FL=1